MGRAYMTSSVDIGTYINAGGWVEGLSVEAN
jgi:hypothetical protein